MKNRRYDPIAERLLSKHILYLCLAGLGLNIGLTKLMGLLGLPLYLDNVGSILTAALGGPLPGMTVGFLSNLISSAGSPNTLYYGILTVLIALAASEFSRRGWLKTVRGCLAAAGLFMLIGGAGGSCLSWLLYGGKINGVAAPAANWLAARGFPDFWAQLSADMLVDAADKLLTMALVYLALRRFPQKLCAAYPLSYLYDRSGKSLEQVVQLQQARYRKNTLHDRMVRLIAGSLLALSLLLTAVGAFYYQSGEMQQYKQNVSNVAKLTVNLIDGDLVNGFLAEGEEAPGYRQTEQKLYRVLKNTDKLTYLYVYQIREDGCHVVFDLDVPELAGEPCGSVVDFDRDFLPYRQTLLAGGEVPPVASNGQYGWLITAYAPIRDSSGATVAYVGADISTLDYVQSILTYLARLLAVAFGAAVLVVAATIWYAQRMVVVPVNALVNQSLAFSHADPENWLSSEAWLGRKRVETGDEIETLYHTICSAETNVARGVAQLRESERRLRESAELERKNRELTEAVRQADAAREAKAEFYSRMSHDMRTPMNGILGLVELSRQEGDPGVLRENIRKIGEAGGYLLGLINDTLDISKLEQKKLTLQKSPIYAREFIESFRDILAPSLAEKKIAFSIDNRGVSTDVYIEADELRLRQIFMNLLSNAIKFTPPGGSVTLTLETRGEENGLARDRFILRDTGVGMSREFMENGLFRPFSQEHNSLTAQYAGSGLGLAIVKNLVELMDGSIRAESAPGEGTAFILELDFPLLPPEQASCALEAVQEPACAPGLRGRRVLLCEDNELNAEIAARLLAAAGVVSERAVNGAEAVSRFAASGPGWFDAVLMDIRMPVLDGISAARAIRALPRPDAAAVPIIAMTANAYLEDREQTRAAGMNAHLAKPINTREFYRVLAELLGCGEEETLTPN